MKEKSQRESKRVIKVLLFSLSVAMLQGTDFRNFSDVMSLDFGDRISTFEIFCLDFFDLNSSHDYAILV